MKPAPVRERIRGTVCAVAVCSLVVLLLSTLTGCCVIKRLVYGSNPDGSIRTSASEELHLLQFSNDCELASVNARYSGSGSPADPASGSAAFESVVWTDVPPATTKSATSFTLDGQVVRPRPMSVRFVVGPRSGTVTAHPGRFIASVRSFITELKVVVVAAQDDGSAAIVSYDDLASGGE